MGLGKRLCCEVGMQLVDGGQLFAGQWVVGWWFVVAGHCSVGMWLCFDGFVEGCSRWLSVSGCWSASQGLMKGLFSCMLSLGKGVAVSMCICHICHLVQW